MVIVLHCEAVQRLFHEHFKVQLLLPHQHSWNVRVIISTDVPYFQSFYKWEGSLFSIFQDEDRDNQLLSMP